jgi:hypothetical protein
MVQKLKRMSGWAFRIQVTRYHVKDGLDCILPCNAIKTATSLAPREALKATRPKGKNIFARDAPDIQTSSHRQYYQASSLQPSMPLIMSHDMKAHHVLPKDLMELQIGQIDLLMAMYASEGEVAVESDTAQSLVAAVRNWCDSDLDIAPPLAASSVTMLLNLTLSDSDGPSVDKALQLDLAVPLVYEAAGNDPPGEPPQVRVRIRQPSWMSKAEMPRLMAGVADDDMFAAIDQIKENATQYIISHNRDLETIDRTSTSSRKEPTVRVWFYFPSISTRSKRDDLINHAPSYGLTGFLLAGKPGILCLEGSSRRIDDYMKFIKTESWGDIPAHHKKVSERYRETGLDLKRTFVDMQEITDLVGERRGERANRSDMKALEAWLNERALGDAFTKVFI